MGLHGFRTRGRPPLTALMVVVGLVACSKPAPPPADTAKTTVAAAPVAPAHTEALGNPEAPIPPQCYTRTAGVANPCWTCHTTRNGNNLKGDWTLQEVYAFSEAGLKNHWVTLFEDPRPGIAAITDAEVQAYVRQDNLGPWLAGTPAGVPDFDLATGLDDEGFLRDGSGWRAIRYQPFPGTFWPTNGASDDIYLRLPDAFRRDAQGQPSREAYKLNLAMLEAALTVDARVSDAALEREVEPIDERLARVDLDGNGRIDRRSIHIRHLPARYAGAAATQRVRRWSYPVGTEFVHTVRYLDPDAPGWLSARVKEFRYAVKFADPGPEARAAFYKESAEEKLIGRLPWFAPGRDGGLRNPLGWEYRGWIEDAAGQLRPQDHEETLACMGCHGGLGITVDSGFGLPRKLPGAAGWAQQSLDGQQDRPQAGHREGEVLTYLRRVGGGDEFRANGEMLARYFPGGKLDADRVQRAAPGGPDGLAELLLPSRERAIALNKAYWGLVRGQRYKQGRMPMLAPAQQVHAEIRNGDTGLRAKGRVYSDGRLWLNWSD